MLHFQNIVFRKVCDTWKLTWPWRSHKMDVRFTRTSHINVVAVQLFTRWISRNSRVGCFSDVCYTAGKWLATVLSIGISITECHVKLVFIDTCLSDIPHNFMVFHGAAYTCFRRQLEDNISFIVTYAHHGQRLNRTKVLPDCFIIY